MSTIPLPALDVRPAAPPPNMLEQYGQLMQLKQQQAMEPLQQQQAQQQVQSGQLDIEAKQRAAADQKAMQVTMQQWAQPKAAPAAPAPGGTSPTKPQSSSSFPSYDDLVPLAIKNGASYQTVQGLQDHVLKMKDQASTIAKNDAQTGSSNANAMKTKNGLITDAMMGVINTPDAQLPQVIRQTAQQLSDQGLFDPPHVQQAMQLAQLAQTDPSQARQQVSVQANSLGAFSKQLDIAQKQAALKVEQGKTDPNSPLYSPSPAAISLGTAPGAAQIQAGQTNQAARTAAAEAAAKQPFEVGLARLRQSIQDGDPTSAAQLLVNGDIAPSQIISSRKPEFAQKAFQAAHDLSGGRWNAQQADAQFNVAKAPANVAFFGSAKSLTDPGGTIDQLKTIGKDLPQGKLPALNSIADWEKAQTGSGPVAKFAAVALGVADDYSKVMGGGVGTDSSRLQILNIIKASQSPEQREADLEGVRGAVHSQINSRIGNNTILQRMYGGAGAGSPSSGNDPFAQFGGKAH